METKFGSLEKKVKSYKHQSRWAFSEEEPSTPFLTANKCRNAGRAESRTGGKETKKIQIKLVTTCNKNEQQLGAKNNAEVWETKWTKAAW